jgi:hypothetical protein
MGLPVLIEGQIEVNDQVLSLWDAVGLSAIEDFDIIITSSQSNNTQDPLIEVPME